MDTYKFPGITPFELFRKYKYNTNPYSNSYTTIHENQSPILCILKRPLWETHLRTAREFNTLQILNALSNSVSKTNASLPANTSSYIGTFSKIS